MKNAYTLPYAAQTELLGVVCRSHGLTLAQARVEVEKKTRLSDMLAREMQAILDVLGKAYAEQSAKQTRLSERATKIVGRNDTASLRRELAAAIKKTKCRLQPTEALRLDSKTPAAFNYARAYIKPGTRLTDQESLIIYTSSRKSSLDPLCSYEIERGFLTQDGPLVKAARAYCKSIGLNA